MCPSNTACSRSNTLATRLRSRCGSSGATAGKKSDTFGTPTTMVNSEIKSLKSPTDDSARASPKSARSAEKMVLESRFREAVNAARPTSTAAPSRARRATWDTSWRTLSRRRRWCASRLRGAKSSAAHTLRSARHRALLGGSMPMEKPSCPHARAASGTERAEKAASWRWRMSRAAPGEEATTVVTVPRRSVMSGP
ncbi:Os03g0248225 [Oryza sativa Japonica Group]|uniref:Os03g0248225 protein n=1 Tax=Oryza sativa subsp. japonica TaxID=39947 RepID=A0A0N7KGX9_ORYSJ|nr:hypothetical protein EE612_016494 [Oryza sativa]BAS83265.1 Os03g0248225 [Oryza sativa Japonica Group]